jgi:antitoxin component of MazEF toxin-antitoxin module
MSITKQTGMVKRLTKHGNSLALIIDRGVLELLEIDAKTPLSITTDGKCLVVSPIRDRKRRRLFEDALDEVNRKFGKVLKRLAE